MLSVRTVLCSVDFSAATARQVDLAIEICQAFDAQLILHHNQVKLAVGSGVGWMWEPGHGEAALTPEQMLRNLVARVPAGTPAEMRLTSGSIADAVMAVGREVDADLVVLSTRGTTTDEDGSVTERVLQSATLPIFAMHQALHDHRTPRFVATPTARQPLLVPTDLTPASQPAVDVAFDLARRFAFDVHLLHVLPRGATDGEVAAHARRMMAALAPPDLPRLEEHIATGIPARAIAYAAEQISAALIVMGEHARSPMRHWFRPDTAQAVLHPAPCPIWYVPQRSAAAAAARSPTARAAQAGGKAAPQAPHASDSARRLVDELQDTSFHYWPSFYLYGVVDSTEAAESALADLLAAGVTEDHLHTWHGPAGAAAIDPTGQRHGRMARLWRALERATGERELLEHYANEVESGHVGIGVHCGAGEGRRVLTEILQKHGGHLISYFSVGSVERLSP